MEKYITVCNGKAVLVTDDKNVLDIRELKMGKRTQIVICFEEGE